LKATGVTRPIDLLGRVVIPMELRRTGKLETGDLMEFFVNEEFILMRRFAPGCVFCNSRRNLTEHRDRQVCSYCRDDIRKLTQE
jgi:transcriptional pleiotropic regulator of transition state genes